MVLFGRGVGREKQWEGGDRSEVLARGNTHIEEGHGIGFRQEKRRNFVLKKGEPILLIQNHKRVRSVSKKGIPYSNKTNTIQEGKKVSR